ncbi:MAG: glutaminyl-peptide cyclotransferase [Candidatus Latescibacterota bacterium]
MMNWKLSNKTLSVVLSMIALAVFGSMGCSCDDNGSKPKDEKIGVVYGTPTVLNRIAHDTQAYTQGLLYSDSMLYESNGRYTRSSLRELDPYDNGRIIRNIPVAAIYFAEGLALKDDHLVQLTYVEEQAFVYTYPGMDIVDTLTYKGQGWGLTTDGNRYIMSNGSDTLYFRDDEFNITGKVQVTLEGNPVNNLNELEYVHGKVWANRYMYKDIYLIDPLNGEVRKVIDCSQLDAEVQPKSADSVLNGIAYNSDSKTYYVTGKNWKYIFEVTLP